MTALENHQQQLSLSNFQKLAKPYKMGGCELVFVYNTIKPPAMRVVPSPALALDKKTSCAIISVGLKLHYITKEVSKMDKNTLSHTTWECKYHIVFAPKFRRQIIYGAIKADVANI